MDGGFHYAQTESEQALAAILNLSDRDDNLGLCVRGIDGKDKSWGRDLALYFTPALQAAWKRVEAEELQRNCGGRYVEGDICGIETHPIRCLTDMYEKGYVYRTETATPMSVVISYRWPHFTDIVATYRLVRQGDRWLMDGVSCAGYLKFNMD